jgi:hypothetical protein
VFWPAASRTAAVPIVVSAISLLCVPTITQRIHGLQTTMCLAEGHKATSLNKIGKVDSH